MFDNPYELENEIIEEENDYDTVDRRPFTSDQGVTGKRQKVKTNNFYGIQSSERLPVMYPPTRPYSEKGAKPSGRHTGQNTSFKSHDKSSNMIIRDLEPDQNVKNFPSPKRYVGIASSGMQKNYKIIPKNIPQDKERLYDENLNLKNLVHVLREENLKLKTRVNVLEKESIRVERIMAEQNDAPIERDLAPKASENHLVVGLKNRLTEVENTLHEKEAELTKLKKSVKVTKLTELEVQLKTITEESYRLKGVLDQLIKEKIQSRNDTKGKLQEECLVQAAQIKALEKDHEQLVKIVKAFEQQSAEYEKKLNECEKKKKQETQKLKKLVAEKEKENMRLQQDLDFATTQLPLQKTASFPTHGKRPTITTKEEIIVHEFDKKKAENASLAEQLAEKNHQIQQLEKLLKEANKMPTENKQATLNHIEKSSFRKQSERFNKPLTLNIPTEATLQPAETKPHVEELRKEQSAAHVESEEHEESRQDETTSFVHEESGRINSVPRKRVQKVKAEDVKDLGYEINLALRVKGVSLDELNKMIWPQGAVQSGRLSVREAVQILKSEPFDMKNEDDAILIARYLVEENQEEYIFYNEEAEGELVIIKSILRKLIGNIPKWDKETAKRLHDSISEICTKYQLSLRENLRVTCKDGYLNRKALQEVLKLVEVSMSEEQLEFIITKLFERSRNTQALAIENLFEIFYKEPKVEEIPVKPKEEPQVEQPKQTINSIPPKSVTPLSLPTETKPKSESAGSENKLELRASESSGKNKTPSQGVISQNDVKSLKSSSPQETPKEQQIVIGSQRSNREQNYESERYQEEQNEGQAEENISEKNNNDYDDAEQYIQEDNDEYPDSPKQNQPANVTEKAEEAGSNKGDEEHNEEDYKFEEEGEEGKEQQVEEDQQESQGQNGEQERAGSIEVSDSRRRLDDSQPTNHTNTTQFTEPKSEVYGIPSRTQHEERKGDSHNLNTISERDETGEAKNKDKKADQEEEDAYASEEEYKEDVEEEVEEQNEEEKGKSKDEAGKKAVKAESEGEEYNDEEMNFEEVEDDS